MQNNEKLKLFNKGKGLVEEVDNVKNNTVDTKTFSDKNPVLQILVKLMSHMIYMLVLAQQCLVFPIQLMPNDKGRFQSISSCSLTGIFYITCHMLCNKKNLHSNAKLKTKTNNNNLPWKINNEKTLKNSMRAFACLLIAQSMTGKFSVLFEDMFYIIAGMGMFLNMTMHAHRSLVVLFGHMS